MLMGLHKYKDFELKNVAQAEVDTTEKPKEQAEAEKIPDADFNTLVERFKQVLGERVTDVRASNRLSQSVARLADADGNANPELQRVYKYLGKEYEIPKKILELNPIAYHPEKPAQTGSGFRIANPHHRANLRQRPAGGRVASRPIQHCLARAADHRGGFGEKVRNMNKKSWSCLKIDCL